MTLTEHDYIKLHPDAVGFEAYRLYFFTGSWPEPGLLHRYLADRYRYPLEHAEHDTLVALDCRTVYGLPTVVGRRLGEVEGDWRSFADEDHPFRIAMREEDCPIASRQFDKYRKKAS